MKFGKKQTIAYGLGAVGKDMVYALSSGFVLYYYQDVIGLNAGFVGIILMIARVFDAINDPMMGVVVAKTNSKWGRFRPWILTGTVLNAFILYALFAAPDLSQAGMMVFFSVIYILWGVSYTMMDIPFWSMIPAVTNTPQERESLSVVGRTCAGVGNALITIGTVFLVGLLGGGSERVGFKYVALIVSILFVLFELILFLAIKEGKDEKEMETASIKEMFSALIHNDQAMVTVVAIVLVNSALYITSNLIIYFFKYDFGGADWSTAYTLFTSVGGASQILGMMIGYPLLRKKFSNIQLFKGALCTSITGYIILLVFCLFGLAHTLPLLFIPGVLVFAANGILTVLTTVFLSATVDYGEIKSGRREESVIFSMQTFVVKLASGASVFIAGIGLQLIGLNGNSDTTGAIVEQSASSIMGLRCMMTLLPTIGLIVALIYFSKKYILTDEKAEEIAKQLAAKKEA